MFYILSPVSSLQQLFYACFRVRHPQCCDKTFPAWSSSVFVIWLLCQEITITLFFASMLGLLDVILNFPGFHRWKFTEILRNILKIVVSLAWCVVLPLCYAQSVSFAPGMLKQWLSFLPRVKGVPPLYILAVALYLLPNVLAAIMFSFPMLRRWIENSDWHIIRLLLWWSQVWGWIYDSFLFILDENYDSVVSKSFRHARRALNSVSLDYLCNSGSIFPYCRLVICIRKSREKFDFYSCYIKDIKFLNMWCSGKYLMRGLISHLLNHSMLFFLFSQEFTLEGGCMKVKFHS